MDIDRFLQNLHELSLEESKAYIKEHIDELSDYAAVGNLLADEALRFLYSPFLSLKLAELLIFYGNYVQHTLSHALGLKSKGDALVQIGHFQAAIESLDAAGDEFLHLGDEGNWARSRISWITACASLGRAEEALQEANRAREMFLRLGEYYWVCVIDHNVAWIYEEVGRYQDALKLYESMLSIYPTLVDRDDSMVKRSIAIAQMNKAINLSWLGQFEEAYDLLQQAKTSFIALDDTSLINYSEVDLANLDYAQGYYGSALRRYYQARDRMIQNNIDNPLLLAELKMWTANCLVKLNREQEAYQLIDETVEVYRQLGTSLQTSNALSEYATILVATHRFKEALAILDEVWTLFDRGGFDRYASATKLRQAELLLAMGSVTEAYEEASHLKEYFETGGLVTYIARTNIVIIGALLESARKAELAQEKDLYSVHIREAVLLCEQAIIHARQHNLQQEVYKSEYLLGQIYALQGNTMEAARHFRASISQIEHILNDLAFDLSPSFLHTTWAVYEDMIALCLQQGQAERAFSYLERARSMALRQYLSKSKVSQVERKLAGNIASTSVLQDSSAAMLRTQFELRDWQEKYHDYSALLTDFDTSVSPDVNREIIQTELKRCEAKISELFERLHLYQADTPVIPHAARSKKRMNLKRTAYATEQIDMKKLRQHVSSNELLLAYFLCKGRLVTFAITPERLIAYENPNGLEQLEHLLPLLHAHLDPRGWADVQNPPQQPVCRLLQKLYNLLVAPVASLLPSRSGHLTIVPYGPLHKLPFHALYDGSRYLIEDFQISYLPASSLLIRLGTHDRTTQVRSADIGACIKPPLIFGYSENGYLKRVHDEAKAIASMLDGCCYLESDATIARLNDEARNSPIIHLATHGQSRLDAPNFSSIRLADGQLNAIDAFSLDLKACELVTLSGCETGLALSGGGDEQLGLGRAFLAAGANSLVMSLWPVEDNSTNELMKLFYCQLLKGESKVQALRAAQCSLLHQSGVTSTHPYFWAAFRLVGEVGPIKF
jgi:tetratricopeptide (TPR) repeat protein